MKVAYVGGDVGAEWFDVCVLYGRKRSHQQFKNTAKGFQKCVRWLEGFGAERIRFVLEPTGRYAEKLEEYLIACGVVVLEVQPLMLRRYAESLDMRGKSDFKDAFALAMYCKERGPGLRPWKPKTKLEYELRDLQLWIRSLTKRIVSLKCQRKCGLRSRHVRQRIEEELQRLEDELEEAIALAKKTVKQHPTLSRDMRLLQTIPGIGEKSAVLLVTLIDFRKFKSSRALASFLGLTQRKHQSGTSIRGKESISKRGNKHVRSALFLPARAARRSNTHLIDFAERMVSNGKHDLTIQAAVTRKLVTTAWAVIVHQRPFDPDYVNQHSLKAA